MDRDVALNEPVPDDVRRSRLLQRHHLGGDAPDVVTAVRSVVALHSSDPVTPHLAVLARTWRSGPQPLAPPLYDERTLWRLHAMRRTLFVAPTEDGATLQAAVGRDVAAAERRKLEGWLAAAGRPLADPAWLRGVEQRTLTAVDDGAERRTQDLLELVPELATPLTVGSGRWAAEVPVGTRVLPLLAFDGQLVRTRPAGSWRSSQYRWAATHRWFGRPLTLPDPATARTALAGRYLAAYGPATVTDLRWWTGWTLTRTRAALAALEAVEVPLERSARGFVLPGDELLVDGADRTRAAAAGPTVALLPGLDPTTMGWKERNWYVGEHGSRVFDRNGNAGPSVWVDGRVVGGWAQRQDGEVVARLLEDVGREARDAIAERAASLTGWFDGVVVRPRFPSPLERDLTA
jgi:hypothetical protein